MTGPLIVTALIALLAVCAPRYGADSRDGQDWRLRPGSWRPVEGPVRRRRVGSDLAEGGRYLRRRGGRACGPSRPRTVGGSA